MPKNELVTKVEPIISNSVDIKTMIYTIRGQQVMLDSDLAKIYGYSVKALNQQVQRNIDKFPSDFMFKLNINEEINLKSQIVTSSYTQLEHGGKRKPTSVFTEQGIYMLATVLKGELAIKQSIYIIRSFKELRHMYLDNDLLLDRIINSEIKLIEHDKKIDIIFDYINGHAEVTQKIFYMGQVYDAYSLFIDLISKAKMEITLVDNYIDKTTLDILSKKNKEVNVSVYTTNSRLNDTDLCMFNKEYPTLNIYKTSKFHDRFLILDNKRIYLIGASIKDAGKKCFGIIEMDNSNIKGIIEELNKI